MMDIQEFIRCVIIHYRKLVESLEEELRRDIDLNESFLKPCQVEIVNIPDSKLTLWFVGHDPARDDMIITHTEKKLDEAEEYIREILKSCSDEQVNNIINSIKTHTERGVNDDYYSWTLTGTCTGLHMLSIKIYEKTPEDVARTLLYKHHLPILSYLRNRTLFLKTRLLAETLLEIFESTLSRLSIKAKTDLIARHKLEMSIEHPEILINDLLSKKENFKEIPAHILRNFSSLFNECVELILNDKETDIEPKQRELVVHTLVKFLEEVLRKSANYAKVGIPRPFDARFIFETTGIYQQLEDFLYSKNITIRFFSILLNFKSEQEVVELPKNMRIRKLDYDEIGKIKEGFRFRNREVEERLEKLLLGDIFIIENDYTAPRWANLVVSSEGVRVSPPVVGQITVFSNISIDPSAMELHNNVITALRLLKDGYVDILASFIEHSSLFDPPSLLNFKEHYLSSEFFFRRQQLMYTLKSEDVNILTELLNHLVKRHDLSEELKERLERALRRFNFSYERVFAEDKIIDLFISLEVLLTKGERQIGSTLANRCAMLHYIAGVIKEYQQLREIRRFIQEGYNIRHDIVHHGIPTGKLDLKKVECKSIDEFVIKLREFVRRTIVIILSEAQKVQSYNELIDMIEEQKGKLSDKSDQF